MNPPAAYFVVAGLFAIASQVAKRRETEWLCAAIAIAFFVVAIIEQVHPL